MGDHSSIGGIRRIIGSSRGVTSLKYTVAGGYNDGFCLASLHITCNFAHQVGGDAACEMPPNNKIMKTENLHIFQIPRCTNIACMCVVVSLCE